MRLRENIVRHELIGLTIVITEAKNLTLVGLTGKIIGETKNILMIKSKKLVKKVIKNQILKMKIKENKIVIYGKDIIGRPHERILRR